MTTKKLYPDDEGGLTTAIYIKDDQIVMAFGKDIAWLSVGVAEAKVFIATMQKKIDELERKDG